MASKNYGTTITQPTKIDRGVWLSFSVQRLAVLWNVLQWV